MTSPPTPTPPPPASKSNTGPATPLAHPFALTIGQFFALFIIGALLGGLVLLASNNWTDLPDRIAQSAEHFVLPGFNVLAAGCATATGLAAIGALPLLSIWVITRLWGAFFRHRRAKRGAFGAHS